MLSHVYLVFETLVISEQQLDSRTSGSNLGRKNKPRYMNITLRKLLVCAKI
jgi:hypothetical protein